MSDHEQTTSSCRCSACGFRFRVQEKYVGRKARCPNPQCGQTVLLQPEDVKESATRNPVRPTSTTSSPGVQNPGVQNPGTSNPVKSRSASTKAGRSIAPEVAQSTGGSSQRAVAGSRVNPGVRTAAISSASATSKKTVEAAQHRGASARSTRVNRSSSRYEAQGSNFKSLVLGLLGTCLIGGVAMAFFYWKDSDDQQSVTATNEQTSVDSETGVASSTGNSANDDQRVSGLAARGSATPGSGTPGQPAGTPLTSAQLAGTAQLTAAPTAKALQRDAQRQQFLEDKFLPFLKTHCADCHNAESQDGGIVVDQLSTVNQLLKDRKQWERIYRMINAGAMPPSDYDPKPEEPVRKEMADFLHEELFNFDCSTIHHAGRSTLHRLNRAEYNNTIRDLFGLQITPADKFPQDDVGEGFDNIGDVLTVPPLLMEKYLDAAEEVASQVIDLRDFSKGSNRRTAAAGLTSSIDGSIDGEGFYILHTNGTLTTEVDLPRDGMYTIRIEATATQAGDEDAKMVLGVDGQTVKEFNVKARRRQPAWYEEKIQLSTGKHSIVAAFTNDFFDAKAPERRRDRNLAVRVIEVNGPEGGGAPEWHETHRRFVTARPDESTSVAAAAATVLRPVLYRAFRRPVSDREVGRLVSLVETSVTEFGESYDYGLFVALQAILVSPDFLFRKEADPEGDATERSLNEYEVASRLSYFLWSSMPDDELFQLAENKRLLDRGILRSQIERMMKDDKAAALARNFASQWLNLRNLSDVRPNPDVFPDFDDSLRHAMSRETELLFNTIVKEDRSIDEFLAADFTFVNSRLAKHYGIEGVNGDEFVRVSLQGSQRAGVLTHASILTLTSNPGRTSPVKRGKWILENILGEAPPPAPPGVPELEESTKHSEGLSLRERLELHRADPGCASCHKAMDPLGMGFENFDAVGRWRDQDEGRPVDASGDLPTGQSFSGPQQLISIIQQRKEQFARTFAERLMVYALGRGLEYYDKCAVDHAVKTMKDRGNRFSALVEGIVTSDPFLKRSKTRQLPPP